MKSRRDLRRSQGMVSTRRRRYVSVLPCDASPPLLLPSVRQMTSVVSPMIQFTLTVPCVSVVHSVALRVCGCAFERASERLLPKEIRCRFLFSSCLPSCLSHPFSRVALHHSLSLLIACCLLLPGTTQHMLLTSMILFLPIFSSSPFHAVFLTCVFFSLFVF